MKEKSFEFKKIKEEEEVVHLLPPAWCSSICRNAMNEVCIEHCAIKRDCSAFEEKPNLNLSNMPRFPETKGMTKEEKFTSVTVYLSKVIDHLQGNKNEPENVRYSRASRTVRIEYAIAEIAAGLKDSQDPAADAGTNKTTQQPTTASTNKENR